MSWCRQLCREQPCPKDCPLRSAHCHGKTDGKWNCEKWGAFQDRKDREREEKKKEFPIDNYISDQVYRNRKRKLKEGKKHG